LHSKNCAHRGHRGLGYLVGHVDYDFPWAPVFDFETGIFQPLEKSLGFQAPDGDPRGIPQRTDPNQFLLGPSVVSRGFGPFGQLTETDKIPRTCGQQPGSAGWKLARAAEPTSTSRKGSHSFHEVTMKRSTTWMSPFFCSTQISPNETTTFADRPIRFPYSHRITW
jgi:hypothetical protein